MKDKVNLLKEEIIVTHPNSLLFLFPYNTNQHELDALFRMFRTLQTNDRNALIVLLARCRNIATPYEP